MFVSAPHASRCARSPGLLACLIITLSLPLSISALAQESNVWLPRNLQAAHSEAIQAVVRHALTRQGCENILEAKLGGQSADDTKYIVTCETESGDSVNLVYWSTDVETNFANVSYPEKSKAVADSGELLSVLSEEEKFRQLANCRAALAAQALGKNALLIETNYSVQLRPSQTIVTFLALATKTQPGKISYTATCLSRENQTLKIEIFNQQ